MSYRLTIVNDRDEVLGVVNVDGYDLRKPGHQLSLGERVNSEMGTRAVEDCAGRREPEEEL